MLLFGHDEYGNPREKSPVGQDGLVGCLQDLGVEPDKLNALLQALDVCGHADV